MKSNKERGLVYLTCSIIIIFCSIFHRVLETSNDLSFTFINNQSNLPKNNTFAEAEYINKSILEIGQWENTRTEKPIWKYLVHSRGSSLNFGFSQFYLPKTATLKFINIETGKTLLALTAKSNKAVKQYWTPIFKHNAIQLTLEVAAHERELVQLELKTVNHGIVNATTRNSQQNDCMIDVICGANAGFPEIDQYRDIIQSVGMTSIDGTRICSGVLINNTTNDKTPYFLSARHCGIDGTNINSVVVHWNYENSSCRFGTTENGEEGDGDLLIFNSGASLVADFRDSDMILMLLDEPVNPDANAFFAGWDRREETPVGGVIVHHASSLEKRISFDENEMEITRHFGDVNDPNENHIRVGNYELGSTAQGSSGAALFNKDKRVVGQLHGGRASCEQNEADWYGRFFTSWLGEGIPERQLMPWLDPLNSNAEFIDGIWDQQSVELQVSIIQTSEILCAGASDATIMIEVQKGTGPYEYSIDDGINFQNEPIFSELNAGDYNIQVKDANGVVSSTTSYTIDDGEEIIVSSQVLYNQVNLKVNGGVEPYEYSISNEQFQDDPIFRGLASGAYTFEVRDANDCIVQYELVLMVTPFVVEMEVFQDLSCFDDTNGVLEINVFEGGFPPFVYSLDDQNFQNSPVFENVGVGAYVATIQDFIGNKFQTDTVTIGGTTDEILIQVEMFEDFIQINASGGFGSLMYSIDGVNFIMDNIFVGFPSDAFFVYVMDENGCVSVSDEIIISNRSNLIDEAPSLVLYPNPAKDYLTLEWQKEDDITAISVLSITGQLILDYKELSNSRLKIDLAAFESGIYLVRLESEGGKTLKSRTFVINK